MKNNNKFQALMKEIGVFERAPTVKKLSRSPETKTKVFDVLFREIGYERTIFGYRFANKIYFKASIICDEKFKELAGVVSRYGLRDGNKMKRGEFEWRVNGGDHSDYSPELDVEALKDYFETVENLIKNEQKS